MSFSDAFSYPYKSLPKVFTIVLGFAIVIAVMVVIAINTRSIVGTLLLTGGIVIAQSLFLTGYGIRVIRSVMDGIEPLPNIEIGEDIKRGFLVSLSGILHFLPLVALGILAGMMGVFNAFIDPYGRNADGAMGMLCLVLLIGLPLMFLLSWGFVIGMARYAVNDDSSALWQVGTNFGIAKDNVGACFSMSVYQFVMAIMYTILTQVVSAIYNGITGGMISFRTPEMVLVGIIILSYILSITISILNQFANLHFIAQLANKIGLEDEKQKHKIGDEPNPLRYEG